jgi:murein DD-endopeptidase MepM/ murein hydrolase activator NlpD
MKRYRWPIDGLGYLMNVSVSQRFGNKYISEKNQTINGIEIKKGEDVYLKVFGWKGHNGMDFAAPRGTPIRAIADGWIIEQTGKQSGYGLRISQLIERPGRYHVAHYGHLHSFARDFETLWNINARSFPVREGEIIGYVDSTGFSTGDHLHLGLYEYDYEGNKLNQNNGYGGAIDPAEFLKVRIPKWVGYRKHPEKNTVLRFPDMDAFHRIMGGELKLTDVFQLEDIPYTLPLDKPEFPI